jgi:hypothetical protein
MQDDTAADPSLLPRSPFKPLPRLLVVLLRQRAAMLKPGIRQRMMVAMAVRAEFMSRSGQEMR